MNNISSRICSNILAAAAKIADPTGSESCLESFFGEFVNPLANGYWPNYAEVKDAPIRQIAVDDIPHTYDLNVFAPKGVFPTDLVSSRIYITQSNSKATVVIAGFIYVNGNVIQGFFFCANAPLMAHAFTYVFLPDGQRQCGLVRWGVDVNGFIRQNEQYGGHLDSMPRDISNIFFLFLGAIVSEFGSHNVPS